MPEIKQVKKPKPGGLFPNDKTAFIDSTLNANKDKEWVRRLYQKNTPKVTLPGEDKPSTHLMADDGNGYVFPTLIQQPNQKGLTNMGPYAEKYARRNNTGIQFKNKEQGDYFATHDNGNGSFGGYKKGTGVLSEFKGGTKSVKIKYKVKKAVNGLQDIAVPEQGSYSNVLSSTSSLASAGSQFGPWGAAIGGVAGLGLGLLQKNKQDAANKSALAINKDNKMNRAFAGNEDTVNQAMQRFKKGGVVKTKTIEIEGKKTPEIHTDKDFNVKNLGTIPHTQGGNKVEAEEGDIVFNTQNSLAKFNKIASHLQEGNKTALTKEKNKLPEDKGMKNQTGNRAVKRDIVMEAEADNPSNPNYKIRTSLSTKGKRPLGQSYQSMKYGQTNYGGIKYPDTITTVNNKQVFNDGYKLPSQSSYVAPKKPSSINSTLPISGRQTKKATPISQILNTPSQVSKFTPSQNMNEPDLSDLKGSRSLDQVAESAKSFIASNNSNKAISSPSQTTSQVLNTPTSKGMNGVNTALQFAGVANNLFQGLKNEKPVDETYVNPNLIKYNDRSQSLRNQSNGVMNAQISNARALSGGNIGNLRANSTAARIANLDRQGSIDEREQGRADAIQAQNVGIQNQANEVNLGRKDIYQNQIMANRAAKQSYIDQAASDIGQYGMAKQEEGYLRNRDRLASDAQMAGYKSINGRYQHKSNLDGSTYFEPDADTSITRFGTSGGNRASTRKKTLGIFKNGTKSVSTKYKLKSVV